MIIWPVFVVKIDRVYCRSQGEAQAQGRQTTSSTSGRPTASSTTSESAGTSPSTHEFPRRPLPNVYVNRRNGRCYHAEECPHARFASRMTPCTVSRASRTYRSPKQKRSQFVRCCSCMSKQSYRDHSRPEPEQEIDRSVNSCVCGRKHFF